MAQTASVTDKYNRKQADILDAAIPVFTERGLGNARLSDVGLAVGLKTTSITYYFKRKEDLASACYLRTLADFASIAQSAVVTAGSQHDSVRCILEKYFDIQAAVREGKRPALMPFDEVLSLRGDHAQEVFTAFVDMFRDMRAAVIDATGHLVTSAHADARAHLLVSQLLWVPAWLDSYDTSDFPRLAEEMYRLYAQGLNLSETPWYAAEPPHFPGPKDSREIFLKAAIEAINNAGYAAASVDRIAARLSLTKGSFYHHYNSKEELGLACFRHSIDVMEGALQETAGESDNNRRLQQLMCNLTSFQLDEAGPLLTAGAIRTLSPALREEVLKGYQNFSDKLAEIVAAGIAEGSIRPVDPLLASQMLTRCIIAAHELPRWIRDVDRSSALDIYVRPIFVGSL